jgi:hypothetical protein
MKKELENDLRLMGFSVVNNVISFHYNEEDKHPSDLVIQFEGKINDTYQTIRYDRRNGRIFKLSKPFDKKDMVEFKQSIKEY